MPLITLLHLTHSLKLSHPFSGAVEVTSLEILMDQLWIRAQRLKRQPFLRLANSCFLVLCFVVAWRMFFCLGCSKNQPLYLFLYTCLIHI